MGLGWFGGICFFEITGLSVSYASECSSGVYRSRGWSVVVDCLFFIGFTLFVVTFHVANGLLLFSERFILVFFRCGSIME